MWGWIDGHLVLIALLTPVVSYVVVAWLNARFVARLRGGAR